MALAEFVRLTRHLESLAGDLPDRLEHPVARPDRRLALAHEALVEERLQHVWIGAGNLLRGVVRTTADESRQPREQALLLCGEQVVTPGDGRPQRLLAGIDVALAFEQVEAL